MSIAQNYPAISPSLSLDFAAVQALDPRITYTRASTATYYGTETAKAEENLLLQSQAMSGSPWAAAPQGVATVPTNTANAGAAPDGTTTASRWVLQLNGGTATGDIALVRQTFTPISGAAYTYSVFVKSFDGTSTYDAQIIGADGAGLAIAITGAWTRFTVTANGAATAISFGVRLRGGQSPTNSNSADILVWGAQLEQRSAVTAYTPTTTSPITNYIPVLETAASGVARFDHNPTTFESLGLEIEESRTNLYTNSFINQTGGTGMTYSNGFPALDPAQYFVLGQETTANSEHFFPDRNFVPILNTTYAFSVYAKQGSGNRRLALRVAAGNVGQINFNLTNGTAVSTTSGVISNATITPVGNGVYRCTVIWTATSATNTVTRFQLINGVSTVYTGDGYSGIFIWGAQLEAGAFATSYIPTVASQVTRAADDASMTGTNFSSWYNAGEGTMYAEASVYDVSSARNAFVINDGTTSNRILTGHGANPKGFIAAGGTTQMSQNITTVTFSANTFSKVSLAYADNNGNAAANGTIGTLDTAMTIPVVTQLQIGSQTASVATTLNGTIKKLAYYPIRLTDTQLQALTS